MSKRWNVYVTREIPKPALDLLAQHCDMEVNPEDRVLTREELLEKVKGRDGVLCLLTDTIDAEVLDAAKGAVIFANYAVGFNNIDVQAATERGILITNTPGVLTETTADMAWALLFAVARRVVESDKYNRAGKFKGWGPLHFLGQEVTGKTLGVVGGGRIGTSFARKAKGFDMTILYTDVAPNPEFEAQTGGKFVDMETLLKEADFVSLHVPLMPETKHLIGEKELKMMKKSAILINTSRGPVVDELALVKALKEGEIWGAGLDVYEWEPEMAPGLAELDNVVVCPHIASATYETRTKMGMMAVENLLAGLRGEVPPNCLNPEVLKK
ncbi:2-hydroxyacid dehydrogenase [Zhaonella formicivorans]|jgi:lactate dehydrogenase-like 2-hydroxyacid dehydrogenase|uniref:2-hydroxyacid dehydrogenase n=1 Tax=Zhaonella formicivorans TaxID=2528593 RepID=UPI0010E156E4|nr:D-glycerate dehydrogenase [Zhaonella formicivorans]